MKRCDECKYYAKNDDKCGYCEFWKLDGAADPTGDGLDSKPLYKTITSCDAYCIQWSGKDGTK